MMLPSKHAEEKYSSTMSIKFLEEQGLTGAGDAENPGVYIQCDPESAIAALRKIVLDKVKGARPREAARAPPRLAQTASWSKRRQLSQSRAPQSV